MVDEFVRNPRPGTGSREAFAEPADRELEVLKLVARGLNTADIARQLFLNEATIRTHVSRILSKLGLRDRTQAVVAAYEGGLVKPGDVIGR